MTICGLACQKEDAAGRGTATDALFVATAAGAAGAALDVEGIGAVAVSGAFEAALTRFLSGLSLALSPSRRSFSFSFFSRRLSLLAVSSSSVGFGIDTPFRRLVSTSR